MKTIKIMLTAIIIALLGKEISYIVYGLGGSAEMGLGIRIGFSIVVTVLLFWAVMRNDKEEE